MSKLAASSGFLAYAHPKIVEDSDMSHGGHGQELADGVVQESRAKYLVHSVMIRVYIHTYIEPESKIAVI